MVGLLAPPSSAGMLARVRGVVLVILMIVAVLAIGFGLVYGVGQAAGGISIQRAIFYGVAWSWSCSAGFCIRPQAPTGCPGQARGADGRASRPLRRRGHAEQPMCGRYSLAGGDLTQLRSRFPIGESVELRGRFNVAPTDDVLTVTTKHDGTPRGELLRWGLVPAWSTQPGGAAKMINARAKTLRERPAFRSALERFRCLIIADGFYEWSRDVSGAKRAFHITRADREPFAFAGLWPFGIAVRPTKSGPARS